MSNHSKMTPVPLIDLVDAARPITYGILKPGPNIETGVPYVRVVDIQDGQILSKNVRRTTEAIAQQYQRSTLTAGDVLLSIRGHVGRVAIVPHELNGANITQDTARLAPNEKVYGRYLFWAFSSDDVKHWMNRRIKGVAVTGINLGDIKELPIPLPPLSAQKRVADILDKADAIRRKRQEVVGTFGLLTASVFNEMFGQVLSTARWLHLSDYLVDQRYGTSEKAGDGGYTTLRIPNIVRGIIDLKDLKTVEVSEGEFQRLRLVAGDVLFVRTNGNPDYVGRCAVFDPNQMKEAGLQADEIIYASYLIRARLQMDRLRPVFLQSLLQTAAGRRNVREKCRTSAGQYNINTKGIGSLHVPDIDIKDQIAFEAKVSSLRPALGRITAASDAAESLFNSLVQRAFKGEL